MRKFDLIPSAYGRAYRVIDDSVDAIITLINCKPTDEQALLADAVDQMLRLRALKIGAK